MSVFDVVKKIAVVPVISLDNPALAGDLAHALCDGGLPVAEVTFRVDHADEVMVAMKKACPDILIGAGTVLTTKQVDAARSAGAEFIVAPGLNPKIAQYCQEQKIPYIPGVATPTEVEQAMDFGCEYLKFFPAELNGGLPFIKALCAPYTSVKFMPTGGVNPQNLGEYLGYDKIYAAGGT